MNENRYYVLKIDVEPTVIGVIDGGSQAEITRCDYSDKSLYDKTIAFLGSFDSYLRANEVPEFSIELQCVKMRKKAIATDFMLFSPALMNCPWLISKKVKLILENYETGDLKLYPANVFTIEGLSIGYYLFFIRSLDFQVIDFEKSIIFKGLEQNKENIINIKNKKEYEFLLKNTTSFINFQKYCLNDNFDKSLEIFAIGATIFIKENLKNELLESGLSGLSIIPAFDGDNSKQSKILSI